MRVTFPPRQSRRRAIRLTALIIGGLICLVAYGLSRDALRGFDHDGTGPITANGGVTGRVNLLLLGIDQRVGTTEPTRTDTMLLLTFDPQARTAGMLSINRDLWVTFPDGRGAGRINTAHLVGEAEHLPGGGPALARRTVQFVFELPVPYYVRFNFSGFERLIDLIGGVDVTVDEVIDDPEFPGANDGVDPFHLEAGRQHLDGHKALQFVRTRATVGADFARVKRQQQLLLAVRDKLLDQNLLPRLLPQIGGLLQTLGDSVHANLTPRQIYQLINLVVGIERERITAVTLDRSLITPQLIDGQAVLMLNPGAAQLVHDRLYGIPATPVPATPVPADPPQVVTPPGRVSLRGTDEPWKGRQGGRR